MRNVKKNPKTTQSNKPNQTNTEKNFSYKVKAHKPVTKEDAKKFGGFFFTSPSVNIENYFLLLQTE